MCYPNCTCGCGTSTYQGVYGTNMWNVNSSTTSSCCAPTSPCNGCADILKGVCVLYTGSDLVNLGINKNDDINTVLVKIDAAKKAIDDKIAVINSRLDALEA